MGSPANCLDCCLPTNMHFDGYRRCPRSWFEQALQLGHEKRLENCNFENQKLRS